MSDEDNSEFKADSLF